MSLDEMIKNNELQKVAPSIENAQSKIAKAIRFFNSAKAAYKTFLSGNKEIDISQLYVNIYEAGRIGCEALLALHGYKIRTGASHHSICIEGAKQLINTEEFKSEFEKMQRIKKNRNKIEYDTATISESSLNQAIKDIELILLHLQQEVQKLTKQENLL